jgi:hypothetical protein
MDSQFPATREDLYHVQMDVKHVQAVQINHADRLMRLEKRQADDAALKSVWGTSSPFPGVLSGTPQHGQSTSNDSKKYKLLISRGIAGPVQNPSTDVFDDFEDEQGHNLLGSLQLEADEEPLRRGASRANSVRFDVSALQGSNWAQSSRNSGDFGPIRPSSGYGSHPMTERSLSHKSDGRHSSAGHSVHSMHSVPSGRTSSLGLDTNFIIGGQTEDSPLDIPDPPPGLFILGPVPSIIRCWLSTNFSHSALLYAVICTGSQRSFLDYSLARELGFVEQIQKDSTGRHSIRLPVYLPEAIITQPASRSNSPAPQLPALTAAFEIVGLTQRANPDRKKGIRVFLGCDTLRAHNADVLFSQNLMTLYGDDRNKLSVPFVRPEDDNLFKNLCTSNIAPEKTELKATAAPFTPTESKPKAEATPDTINAALAAEVRRDEQPESSDHDQQQPALQSPFASTSTSDMNIINQALEAKSNDYSNTSYSEKHHAADDNASGLEASDAASSFDPTRRESVGGVWGSWRQSASNGSENGRDSESSSGYQRPTRGGRNMKVLKPSKSISSTSTAPNLSSSRTGAAYEPAPSRSSGEMRRKSQAGGIENAPLRWEPKRMGSESEEAKAPKTIASIPRSSNPVGGASAFAWMNSSKPKTSAAAE